jgi:hypothetical protein
MSDIWKATSENKTIKKNGRDIVVQKWIEVTQDTNGVWIPSGMDDWRECHNNTLTDPEV